MSEKDKKVKVTFGLQPYHIEAIEKELNRFGKDRSVKPKYVRYLWDKLGKELSWEPFTLCLYYFEYLENLPPESQSDKKQDNTSESA